MTWRAHVGRSSRRGSGGEAGLSRGVLRGARPPNITKRKNDNAHIVNISS